MPLARTHVLRRPLARILLATGLALLLAGLLARPAGAVVLGGFGVQPRAPITERMAEPERELEAPLQYHGGAVLHSSATYAIYWDPTGAYRGDWKRLIDGYLQEVGAASGSSGNVFALDAQYTDSTGRAGYDATFRGAYTASEPYPAAGCTARAEVTCLTDAQIRAELERVIASGKLPGATGSPIYLLLTPPGVTVCTQASGGECSISTAAPAEPPNGICGYHSAIDPSGGSPVLYAVQPWVAGDAGRIEAQEPLRTAEPSAEVRACASGSELLEEPNQLYAPNPFGGYEQGLADIIINDLSIEQSDILTDPLLDGWYQSSSDAEQSDMCQWQFGPVPEPLPEAEEGSHAAGRANQSISGGRFYLQFGFDSEGALSGKPANCLPEVALEPHFTAPNPINAGDVAAFDASESNISLAVRPEDVSAAEPFTIPDFQWEFGDGSGAAGAGDSSVLHTYAYGGTYTVTLTVTDSTEERASYSESVTVAGPPPPGPGTSASSTSPAQSGAAPSGRAPAETIANGPPASSGPATQASKGAEGQSPAPQVSAHALSHSLRAALRRGLAVGYSVSTRVTGRLELLLARSRAARLKLHGPAAKELPVGSPAAVVIASRVLVTTGGGDGKVRLRLSRSARSRLHGLRHLELTLRLIAREPGAQGASASSAKAVTLHF